MAKEFRRGQSPIYGEKCGTAKDILVCLCGSAPMRRSASKTSDKRLVQSSNVMPIHPTLAARLPLHAKKQAGLNRTDADTAP